jgi:hypothetical protein
MLMVLNVPDRAVMDVMGWSQANMKLRYMHVPNELRDRIADQVGGLLWTQTDGRMRTCPDADLVLVSGLTVPRVQRIRTRSPRRRSRTMPGGVNTRGSHEAGEVTAATSHASPSG